jgi:glucose/mannose-6-phosphate isomerase
MGGSHLAAGILKTIEPGIDIYVHKDYDMPPYTKAFLESSLLIASSYSGNTEEVLSFYNKVKQLYDLPVLCMTLGGQLLELAKKNNDPYIILPQTNFVPRTALGITSIALAYLFKNKDVFYALQNLVIDISSIEQQIESIALSIKDKVPVFYSSNQNLHLAYNWKIKCNETAKQMAFYNIFPEANHNELEGYEYVTGDSNIIPVLLRDSDDHARIQKRFDVFETILKEKGIEYVSINISNSDIYKKVFSALILGDFVTAHIAELQGHPQAQVPLIESFKNKLV